MSLKLVKRMVIATKAFKVFQVSRLSSRNVGVLWEISQNTWERFELSYLDRKSNHTMPFGRQSGPTPSSRVRFILRPLPLGSVGKWRGIAAAFGRRSNNLSSASWSSTVLYQMKDNTLLGLSLPRLNSIVSDEGGKHGKRSPTCS